MAEREEEEEVVEAGRSPRRNGKKGGAHVSSPIFDLMSMIIW
jgi:hypothetical protein